MNRKREVLAGAVAAVGYALYKAFSTPRIYPAPGVDIEPPKHRWRTIPQMKDLAAPLLSPSSAVTPPPYARPGFGLDLSRNQAPQRRLEEFHELPLQGFGRTVLNEGQHQEVLEVPATTVQHTPKPGVRAKFLRWTVRATRDGGTTVSIGGVRFLYGQHVVRDDHLTIWNPHTGERTPYDGGAWSDANHRMGVFVFSHPVDLTRYQIQTSQQDPGMDPVDWTLEGSLNGTYWIPLDVRTAVTAPVERGHWMNFLFRDAV